MSPSPVSPDTPSRGGARPNAGRKSQWPKGTVLKTMRLPAELEAPLKQYALDLLTPSRTPAPKPRRRRKKKPMPSEPPYWVVWRQQDGPLIESLSREMLDAQRWAMAHFGKAWHELDREGWLPVEVEVVLPDWLLAAHST